ALVLCLFSILFVESAAVPSLSSNVPFPTLEFDEVFHFHAYYYKVLSFIILLFVHSSQIS
ncbi:MAG: hypothetical protein ACJ71X_04255, partial [Nitrososphaeraceae archaeon]